MLRSNSTTNSAYVTEYWIISAGQREEDQYEWVAASLNCVMNETTKVIRNQYKQKYINREKTELLGLPWRWRQQDIPHLCVLYANIQAGPGVRAVEGVGLRPLAVGSNPTGRMHILFVVSVVFCQVEVCAWGWSFVQRSPTDCGVS